MLRSSVPGDLLKTLRPRVSVQRRWAGGPVCPGRHRGLKCPPVGMFHAPGGNMMPIRDQGSTIRALRTAAHRSSQIRSAHRSLGTSPEGRSSLITLRIHRRRSLWSHTPKCWRADPHHPTCPNLPSLHTHTQTVHLLGRFPPKNRAAQRGRGLSRRQSDALAFEGALHLMLWGS